MRRKTTHYIHDAYGPAYCCGMAKVVDALGSPRWDRVTCGKCLAARRAPGGEAVKKAIKKMASAERPTQIDGSAPIIFNGMHAQYGRAEFQFCLVARRGVLAEVHIQRRQQAVEPSWFLLKLLGHKGVGVSVRHEVPDGQWARFPDVAPWTYNACERHGVGFSVYAPDGTSRLHVELSSVQTRFVFK